MDGYFHADCETVTLYLFSSSSLCRACLASRDPYCIWLRTGSCANMAPGFKYVSLPLLHSLSLSFFLSLSSQPSSIWRLIKLWRLCSYFCRSERRVVYLKDVNPWCLSRPQPKWRDGWGNIMGTNVRTDFSGNERRRYKSLVVKLCWKELVMVLSLFSECRKHPGVCVVQKIDPQTFSQSFPP